MKSESLRNAGLSLGSNIGDRLANLRAARDRLRELAAPGGEFLQASVYQTAPVDCPDGSPDFYNTVVELPWNHSPHDLLGLTQAIEFHLGRRAGAERNAPRVIDLDILYLGDLVETGGILDLPHPRLTSRRFVLQPLADIRPELVLPGDTATIAEHLARFDGDEPELSLVQGSW